MHMHQLFRSMLFSAALLLSASGAFANSEVTVAQVTAPVSIADGTDYHITSSTPFATGATVSLSSTGGSVVIFDGLKPSRALTRLSGILIDGRQAARGTNCDVRIHAQGTMVLPYTENDHPLTVYSEPGFGGTAVSDFGLEDNNGFMVTLTPAKLNNKIRSFKLRRGFMVTFATLAGGYGYSRCFIAADSDLEVSSMPAILDASISSYRVFKWNDTSKKALANDTRTATNDALNTTSCYSFGNGEDTGYDRECVRHHIYEDWPSVSSVGGNNYTTSAPTIKTNNEPGNSADDHPQTVNEVLANWQRLMATGKRLCSPSSHDGSLNWLRQFMDSIDARGWRCDVLDMHCYWTEGQFGNLVGWYNSYHRPIWVSEWVWGASWNRNGAFSTNLTDAQAMAQNADVVGRLVNNMESWDYIERYFYWNSEADRSKLYIDGTGLTAAGKVYAAVQSKVGYKASLNYAPRIPKSKGNPSALVVSYDMSAGTAVVSWYEPNGEYNASMTLERQLPNSSVWTVVSEIPLQEGAATYQYTDSGVERGTSYRVHVVYADGQDLYPSKTAIAVPETVEAGQALEVDGRTLYAGGNQLVNGDFAFGTTGWTNGQGRELSLPDFEVIPRGGYQDQPFLQAYSHGGKTSAGSLLTTVDVEPAATYYFSGAVNFPGGSAFSSLSLTDEDKPDSSVATVPSAEQWAKFGRTFSTGDYTHLTLAFRWLTASAAYSGLSLQRLFPTQAEALADAAEWQSRRDQAEALHPTFAMQAAQARADSLARVAERFAALGLSPTADYAWRPTDYVVQPSFASSVQNWQRSGNYTGGTQGASSLDGQTCWTARWTRLSASTEPVPTMGVRQSVGNLAHGVYMLRVKAASDHAGLTTQHAYFVAGADSIATPVLSWGVADIASIPQAARWQSLATLPVYVDERTDGAVGFATSKEGAVDNAWKPYGQNNGTGDNREGSFYATDFELLHLPAYRVTTDASHWRSLCLPYAIRAAEGLRLYRVAGTDAGTSRIYLTEVDTVGAGVPCVVWCADTARLVIEEGEPVSRATNVDGVRGYLYQSGSARVARNSWVLAGGMWVQQTSSVRNDRAVVASYSAIIPDASILPVLDTPTAVSLPMTTATAIGGVEAGDGVAPAAYYHIDGTRVHQPAPGTVVIKVKGGRAEKVVAQ